MVGKIEHIGRIQKQRGMKKRQARTTAGNKTICPPIPANLDYRAFAKDTAVYRAYLDEMIEKHPELFPADIKQGYTFHRFVESGKLHLRTRRICLKSRRAAYQLRPDTVMPCIIGTTEAVEKGLYLRRYGGLFTNRFEFGCAI
jgi:hypothetical protein